MGRDMERHGETWGRFNCLALLKSCIICDYNNIKNLLRVKGIWNLRRIKQHNIISILNGKNCFRTNVFHERDCKDGK